MFIFEGRKINTDTDGYLKNSKEWCESMVYALAKEENIILTKQHLEIIHFIREFYFEFNTSPSIRILVKVLAEKYGKAIGNSRYLYRLFPRGPTQQIAKLAGLPKPASCI
ncbi:MAG: TusE/DsrC/DsvC family sulfur relay protein [Candidatus Arsenophonus melophagi]|nr:TusE/DsrC/DsvC family sulfur relay protein [Candidatus Arsenophonus melophagi]